MKAFKNLGTFGKIHRSPKNYETVRSMVIIDISFEDSSNIPCYGGRVEPTYVGPREMLGHSEGQRHSGIHVRSGNVPYRVDHDGHHQPERQRHSHGRHLAIADLIHHRRPTPREHQDERADHLRYYLQSTINTTPKRTSTPSQLNIQ